MSGAEQVCARCGLVNYGVEAGAKCGACGTVLMERAADPYEGKTFGLDLGHLPLKEAVRLFTLSRGESGTLAETRNMAGLWIDRRLRKARVIPLLKGRLLRYRKADLASEPSIHKDKLKAITADLRERGFIPVMDRAVESVTPPMFERLFADKAKHLYALVAFGSKGQTDVEIIAPAPAGEKMITVTNRPFDWLDDPSRDTQRIPGGSVAELLAAMEYRSPEKNRQGLKFSLRDFVAILANGHESRFDGAVSRRFITKVKGDAVEAAHAAQPGAATECAYHAGARAVSVCSACGKTLCAACGARVSGKNLCPSCLPKGTGESDFPFDISGDLAPAGFFFRAAVKMAEIAGLLWIFTVFFPSGATAGSIIAYQFIALTLFLSYFTVPFVMWGATPLQRILGMAVVDVETGGTPPPPSVLARSGYLFLTMLTFVPALGYLSVLRSADRRGAHDRIAGTIALTTSAAMKEKAGAVAIVLALAAGGFAVKNEGVGVFTQALGRAFGGVAPLGRVELKTKWRVNGVESAAYNGRDVAAGTPGNTLTGLDIESGAPVWKLEAVEVKNVYTDRVSGAYIFTGKKGGAPVIGSVSWRDGTVMWTAALDGTPESPPVSVDAGVAVGIKDNVTMFDRTGEKLWSKSAGGRVLSMTPAGDYIIAGVRGGGSVIFDSKTGAVTAKAEGEAVAPGVERTHLFSGRGWARMAALSNEGGREWTLNRGLSLATEDTYAGELLYAKETAVRKLDGAGAFDYPEGCACVGMFRKILALTCPMDRKLVFADGVTGRTMASFDAPPIDAALMLAEEGGVHRLLATATTQGGFTAIYVMRAEPGFAGISIQRAGEFRKNPVIVNLADRGGLLFIAGDGAMGLYDPTPRKTTVEMDSSVRSK